MDALRFSFYNASLDLTRVPMPEVDDPNDVLIKVAYAGLCGTDLQILAGNYPCRQSSDITLGHEFSGVVVDVGTDVIEFQEGDKVVVDPNLGCKRCFFCHAGNPHFCKVGCANNTLGIYKDGGWAQYVLCPEEQVYKLKPNITLEQAVLAEPIACIVHGWDVISPIDVGSKILLIGAGFGGNVWASILHLQGHRNVTITEPSPNKLDTIKKMNTGFKIRSSEELRKEFEQDPDKNTFDVVIDCSGFPPAIEQGIKLLGKSGKFCMYGVSPPNSKIEIYPFDIYWKEIKIMGVKNNPFTFNKALGIIEAMGTRYLNYKNLGIKTFTLKEYKEAIDEVKKGDIIKAVFKIF